MSSNATSLDALDDALLLQIFSNVARGGGGDDLAQPQRRRADEAAEKLSEAWHPAHLARIACVSKCDAAGMCNLSCARTADWWSGLTKPRVPARILLRLAFLGRAGASAALWTRSAGAPPRSGTFRWWRSRSLMRAATTRRRRSGKPPTSCSRSCHGRRCAATPKRRTSWRPCAGALRSTSTMLRSFLLSPER
jgi:hypothetical protein